MFKSAVILAGGLGKRLKPFTEIIPKPLLPIGESSVLELQIRIFKKYGISNIYLATNYKADFIEAFIGDGSKYGVNIHYSKETIPLGTCGPLSLLRDKLTEPFIVMNGDILTSFNFKEFFDFTQKIDADFTVTTKEIISPFNFGRVFTDGTYITDIEEKPNFTNEIVAGIYAFKPELLSMIPDNTYFGIDTLIKSMIAQTKPIGRYLIKDYWLDIGSIEDYRIARDEYKELFDSLQY
jgi:NDP-sugar pyrophosphorylase family protein